MSQTASPSATVTPDDTEIQAFKDKVASKVLEITKKNNKAISGFVSSNDKGLIKIKTTDDMAYDVKLDDALTKYFQISGNSKKEITSNDIKKDDYIIVTGVITDKTIAANSIFIDQRYFVSSGKISDVDKQNYNVTVITSAKEQITLSIEDYTKQSMLDIKTNDLGRIGFSKIKEGDTIHFVIKLVGDLKSNATYSAEKILVIPQEYFLK